MIFQRITERWFLSEPLFFATLCCHKVAENRDMLCPFRSGKLLLEYNPDILDCLSELDCELLLRRELIRILLKHPYQRQPLNAVPELLTLASDITIYEHSHIGINPLQNTGITMPSKLSFEEYYNLLDHREDPLTFNGTDEANGSSLMCKALADASALWEEDEFLCERMNQIIETAMATNQWGSIPGGMKELLKVSLEKSLNVRRQLGLFKASILSTQRRLTRMRPSRRYGWDQMGVIHPYTTKLLVAVDTSSSVESSDLKRFFGILNSFFTYGIPQIDVIQFDAKIQLPLLSIHKATNSVRISGRGGTLFQPPVDYFEQHKEYDGMIVFTDGYATNPIISTRRRILWVLKDKECYNKCDLAPKIYI